MPRPIWSGSISFVLLNIPIKLYSATSPKDIHFHQLHDKDGVRIQQKRVCPSDGKEVAYDHIVKGYEISKDRYVVITKEELESISPKTTKSIDIQDFVDIDQIDPVYFEHSYYVVPDKGASKAYKLLQAAMEESGKVAIARVVLRTKEYLSLIRPMDNALCMSTMLFADEVVKPEALEGLPSAETKPNPRELTMAIQLIDSLATDFKPEKYKDEYRERVLELIERKAEGQEIPLQPQEEQPGKVLDLLSALEASLKAARKGSEPAQEAAPRRKAAGKGAATAESAEKVVSHKAPTHKTPARKAPTRKVA